MQTRDTLTLSGKSVRSFALVLTAISTVTWMGTSIYIPALPVLSRELTMNSEQISATLTLYYFSFAAFMVVVGPASDTLGRRWPVLGGLALFLAGSLRCGFADGVSTFYLGRIAMGLGSAMVQVPVLAMVRDECPGQSAYTVLGLLGALTGLIPVISMLIGGVVIEMTGWRPLFFILAAAGGGSALACLFWISETLPPDRRRTRINLKADFASYAGILFSRQVLLVSGPLLLSAVFQGAYLVAAPYAFQDTFGLSPTLFAVGNLLIVLSVAGGQYMTILSVKRFPPKRLYIAGTSMALAGGVVFTALLLSSSMGHVLLFVFPLTLFAFSFGFMEPVGLNSLLAEFQDTSGMASAVYGSLLLVMQGSGSFAGGLLMGASFSPLAAIGTVIMPAGLAIAALTWAGRDRILEH